MRAKYARLLLVDAVAAEPIGNAGNHALLNLHRHRRCDEPKRSRWKCVEHALRTIDRAEIFLADDDGILDLFIFLFRSFWMRGWNLLAQEG